VDAGELLRRLDERVLPLLARATVRLGRGPTRLRLLTGAAMVSVTAVLLTAAWAADHRGSAGDPTVGAFVNVGVVDGESIPGYVASSRTELARLVAAPPTTSPDGVTYALVTLSAYLAPERLAPILRGVSVSTVYARVPLPDTQTSIERISAQRIPDDVLAGMERVAGEKDRSAAGYRDLYSKLSGDGARERELRTVYESGARVAAAEAAAYRGHCACVYAAVVRGTPAALDQIAKRSEVRAVDPAPEVRRLDRAVFRPPLPEQTDVVRPPADAALAPSMTPSAAASAAVTPPPEPTASAPGATPLPAPSEPPVAPSATPTPEPTGPPPAEPTPPATSGP
jgi:hypothetical protein